MKELKLIEYIKRSAGKTPKGLKLGIGDDCAVIDHDGKKYLLWASDMVVEGTHFDLKEASFGAIGRKAIAVNISDIASMGGVPKFVTVSIGVPRTMNISGTKKVFDGIFKICKEYGITVAGGDTVKAERLVIDVSIIGFVRKEKLVTRSGAKEKDLVLVTGPIRDGKKEHLKFIPRVKEAQFLVNKYKINSMMDTSDGIALDMGRICDASRVGCRLFEGSFPLSKGLSFEDALYYGESFELLFTASSREVKKLFTDSSLKREGLKYYIIGEITNRKKGKSIFRDEGKIEPIKMKGFEHI